MTNERYLDTTTRQDFVLFFDVTDGNPNGDPDAGNLPRVDPETMQGLVTDVAIKRKVRDFVDALHGEESKFKIYVQSEGGALNSKHKRAYKELRINPGGKKDEKRDKSNQARDWMCENFYDVRTFGAVMSTGDYVCGQVRGPLQLTFARSIEAIVPMDITITRVAVTREEDDKETEMGRKAIVPYGLYRAHGFFNPHFAQKTGFDSEDLALFWQALQYMWDFDRSAARGLMACRGLYVFSHESALGNAQAHKLFERISCEPRGGQLEVARAYSDYQVTIDETDMPEGVTLSRLLE